MGFEFGIPLRRRRRHQDVPHIGDEDIDGFRFLVGYPVTMKTIKKKSVSFPWGRRRHRGILGGRFAAWCTLVVSLRATLYPWTRRHRWWQLIGGFSLDNVGLHLGSATGIDGTFQAGDEEDDDEELH